MTPRGAGTGFPRGRRNPRGAFGGGAFGNSLVGGPKTVLKRLGTFAGLGPPEDPSDA